MAVGAEIQPWEVLASVKNIICEVWNLGPREQELTAANLLDDCLLFDVDQVGRPTLEFDSLDALEISLRIEEVFEVKVPETFDPHEISSPDRIAAWVLRLSRSVPE